RSTHSVEYVDSLSFLSKHPASTAISTLSLHDALPIFQFRIVISVDRLRCHIPLFAVDGFSELGDIAVVLEDRRTYDVTEQIIRRDRKSTRLNSSHVAISYAVFCLKKKNSQRLVV